MDLAKASRDPWVWVQLVLCVLVLLAAPLMPRHLNLGGADFLLNRLDPSWIRWLGAPLMAAGAVIAGWGIRSLGANLTPGTEPLAGASLITTGAFAHRRHPIYGGAVLILTGYTLVWSNWTLALIVYFISRWFFESKARKEEQILLVRFPEYERYRKQVQRRLL
jgi:protein-S-isoprenylcysteine O-methyltransferase Ste14